MSMDILGDWGDAGAMYGAAVAAGADQSFVTTRWAGTADMTAADLSREPQARAPDKQASFWENLGSTVVGYALAKDIAQTRAQTSTPGGTPQAGGGQAIGTEGAPVQRMRSQVNPLWLVAGALALAAGGWFLAKRA